MPKPTQQGDGNMFRNPDQRRPPERYIGWIAGALVALAGLAFIAICSYIVWRLTH